MGWCVRCHRQNPQRPEASGTMDYPGLSPLRDPCRIPWSSAVTKLVGVGVAAPPQVINPRRTNPYLVAPEDILPGVPYFYASTCRECPVGCGIVVRARERSAPSRSKAIQAPDRSGRSLRPRASPALQGLMIPIAWQVPDGAQRLTWKNVTWDEGDRHGGRSSPPRSGRPLPLTGLESGSTRARFQWSRRRRRRHVTWELVQLRVSEGRER